MSTNISTTHFWEDVKIQEQQFTFHIYSTDHRTLKNNFAQVFDRNGDGQISSEELKTVMHNLGEKLSDDEIDQVCYILRVRLNYNKIWKEIIRTKFTGHKQVITEQIWIDTLSFLYNRVVNILNWCAN